jgi:hypothetical protein
MSPFPLQPNGSKTDFHMYQLSLRQFEQRIVLLEQENQKLRNLIHELELSHASMSGRDKIIGFALGAFIVSMIQILISVLLQNGIDFNGPNTFLNTEGNEIVALDIDWGEV